MISKDCKIRLVHCCRCGMLYEEEEQIGMVMEVHLPERTGFIGGICGCGDFGERRDGRVFGVKRFKEKPNFNNGWYADWIADRWEKYEK